MKRVERFLRVNWKLWGGILVLLAVELFCIVGISGNIYNIRYTGGENSGMQYMVAEMLPVKSWQWAAQYMSDSELNAWTSCYEEGTDGYYHLKNSYEEASTMERLEQQFMEPQAVVWYIGQMEDGQLEELLSEQGDYFTSEYLIVRDIVADAIREKGGNLMYTCAKNFVQEESGKCGVNLKGIKVNYVIRQILKCIFSLIFVLGCMVGTYFLNQRFMKVIKQRILEPEVARTESTYYSMAMLLWQGICFVYAAIWLIKDMGLSLELVTGPVIVLCILAALVLCLRKLNIGLSVCERWGYQGRMQRSWLNGFQLMLLFGFPLLSFLSGLTMVLNPGVTAVIWMLVGDIILALIAFLMPDLFASVDGVDNVDDISEASIVK